MITQKPPSLKVATYNVRALSDKDKLIVFEEELQNFEWDQRVVKGLIKFLNKNILYDSGNNRRQCRFLNL